MKVYYKHPNANLDQLHRKMLPQIVKMGEYAFEFVAQQE